VTVRVVAFARIREILGDASLPRTLDAGDTIASVWRALAREHPSLAPLRESTRFACNGVFAAETHVLGDGDEVALLPPFGGG
jgi:molybdopterin converting factor small subunit